MSLLLRHRSSLIAPGSQVGALNPWHPWTPHCIVAVIFDGADTVTEVNRGRLGGRLTNTGTLMHQATKFGRALTLSGANSRDVPNHVWLNHSTMPRGFTIAAVADVGSVGCIVARLWNSGSFFAPYGLTPGGSGTANAFVRAGAATFQADYSGLALNTGMHVYGSVFDGVSIKSYFDGKMNQSTAVTNAVASTDDTTGALQIGQDNWNSKLGNGPIRLFVMLRNYAASAGEMREFALNPMGLFAPEPFMCGDFQASGSAAGARPVVFFAT